MFKKAKGPTEWDSFKMVVLPTRKSLESQKTVCRSDSEECSIGTVCYQTNRLKTSEQIFCY